MKCPRCNCKILYIDDVKGYSNDPVKTCKKCGYKWVNHNQINVEIKNT